MMLIANLQYGWTLFVRPIRAAHGWTIAEMQVAFSIFIALEAWLTPAGGWMVDALGSRRGPKFTVALGGALVGVAWTINAYADSLACSTWARPSPASAPGPSTRPASATP